MNQMTDEQPLRPLQDERGFLAAVMETVEDAIIACDAAGVLTLFNRAAREFHGLPEAPIPAEQWAAHYDLYLPDARTLMRKEDIPLFRALQGEHVRDVEMVVAPKGGTARTLLASARPLSGPDGDRLGAVVIMHDITERKQAQEALKRESSLMQALMDNIPDAIYFKDTESRFTRVNQHAPYRGGNAPEDVIGKTDFDFFIKAHARAAYEDEQRIIRTGEPIIDKEEKETYPDGASTWLSTTKVPIFDEAGQVTGIVGISRDITERKRAEEERIQLIRAQAAREEAEAANRFKDEFLAVASHELRTPLTPILGWANMLRTSPYDEAMFAQALESIERNAKAQQRLVDDLLDISRIITGNLRLDAITFELAPVVEAAVTAMRPAADAKHIRLQTVFATGGDQITGDPDRIRQVVLNLLANAIKFTPQGGSIEVRLERTQSQVELKLSDTGMGISPEFLPHVFARFRQADSSVTRTHGGLGLGLSIVRHLVELHGGTVHADSPGMGQGATFTVKLPLTITQRDAGDSAQESLLAKGSAPGENSHPLHGLRMLLVDDEADTLEMLTMVLKRYGAEVTVATSVSRAMAALESRRPDVLISDIGLPGEDGYELIRQVRALPAARGGNTPALALTAYARTEDRAQALLAGYQLHVPKPVEPAELVVLVASLVGRATQQG
ncbi:MAG: PAS domain-containing protein [Pyrinomonadaceae bacterium]